MEVIEELQQLNILYKLLLVPILLITLYLSCLAFRYVDSLANKTLYKVLIARKSKHKYKIPKIKIKNNVILNVYNKNKNKMLRAGKNKDSDIKLYFVFAYLIPVGLAVLLIVRKQYVTAIVIAVLFRILVEITVYKSIQNNINMFHMEAYKIYAFLSNQINSGISNTTAIKSLHKAVNDKMLKKRLLLMANTYMHTSNIERSVTYITDYYKTYEAYSLAIAIQQGIKTGTNSETIEKKEDKLFNTFLNIIQKETQTIKIKYAFIAIIFVTVLFIIHLYPIFLDMGQVKDVLYYN